jgi:c-di-GMP-binding flagellar brake protein YcgR
METKRSTSFDEKRRAPRIKTLNLVGYALFNEKGKRIGQGRGHTVNLSQTGTLLETETLIQGSYIVLMTIDLDGKKIKVQGRVVRSEPTVAGEGYLTGVEFMGPREEQLEAIVAFVRAYQHNKRHGLVEE